MVLSDEVHRSMEKLFALFLVLILLQLVIYKRKDKQFIKKKSRKGASSSHFMTIVKLLKKWCLNINEKSCYEVLSALTVEIHSYHIRPRRILRARARDGSTTEC